MAPFVFVQAVPVFFFILLKTNVFVNKALDFRIIVPSMTVNRRVSYKECLPEAKAADRW